MDFGSLPPEINSARLVSGPGSGPMLAAASAWTMIAAELRSTALAYHAEVEGLVGSVWLGSSSIAMRAAAASFISWISEVASQAEDTAAGAKAAAAAYEAAVSEIVPLPAIVANRVRCELLIATNAFGQNGPAIAAANAEYVDMWIRDAVTMYSYARAAAAASQLAPFISPEENSNLASLLGELPAPLREYHTKLPAKTAIGSLVRNEIASFKGSWQPPKNPLWTLLNSFIGSAIYTPGSTLSPFFMLIGGIASIAGVMQSGAGTAVSSPLAGLPAISGVASHGGGTVAASLGGAASAGRLSVPPSWAAAAPPALPAVSPLGLTPLAAPKSVAAGMPAIPVGKPGQSCTSCSSPQYGLRLTVMARPYDAGHII